jgi:hypothetical protein
VIAVSYGNQGVSKTTFIIGIIAAIVISGVISFSIPGQVGPQGPQGETGSQGPTKSIPHTSSTAYDLIIAENITEWQHIDENHYVTITLEEESHVVILYTMECNINPQGDAFYLRAWIDGTTLTAAEPMHYMFVDISPSWYSSISSHFYTDLSAGEYTVHIQWNKLPDTGTLEASHRALTVFAIPNTT